MENRQVQSIYVNLIKASQNVQKGLFEICREENIKVNDFLVLGALYQLGAQSILSISKNVLIKSGSMTYIIDELEKKELIYRTPSKEDRRVILIDLTEEGYKQAEKLYNAELEMFARMFEKASKKTLDNAPSELRELRDVSDAFVEENGFKY